MQERGIETIYGPRYVINVPTLSPTFPKLPVVFYYAISHELVTISTRREKLRSLGFVLEHRGGKKCTTLLIITLGFGHALKKITSDNLDINYRYVP